MTKGFGPDAVTAAAAAGCRRSARTTPRSWSTKAATLSPAAGVDVHFIGQLQSNKVRQLAGAVDVWETVDRRALVAEIARRAPGATVLVQVERHRRAGQGRAARSPTSPRWSRRGRRPGSSSTG